MYVHICYSQINVCTHLLFLLQCIYTLLNKIIIIINKNYEISDDIPIVHFLMEILTLCLIKSDNNDIFRTFDGS